MLTNVGTGSKTRMATMVLIGTTGGPATRLNLSLLILSLSKDEDRTALGPSDPRPFYPP